MQKFVIKFNREGCIGAATCVAAQPEFWKLAGDGKTDLLQSKGDDNNTFTKEISKEELEKTMEAAQSCPVNVIHIFDEKGNKLI
jgi:ferredoxin